MYGPLIFAPPETRPPKLFDVLSVIEEAASHLRVRSMTGSLPVGDNAPSFHGNTAAPELPLGWEADTRGNILVSLNGDEESLWRRLKPAARKAVQKARRAGVTVRALQDRAELETFYQFVRQVRRKGHRLPLGPIAEMEAFWDHLRPSGSFDLFVAEWRGKPLAGLGAWQYGGHLVEYLSVTSLDLHARSLNPNDMLKWEIIRWARAQGAHTFDLAGIALEPETPKEANIRRFKEKWGGQVTVFWQLSRNLSGRKGRGSS
jgi:CelD/BcsL family acetyltransferase involved in cellulose biosynthesis